MPTLAELAHTRARQRLEILDRVSAGETLRAACARPGMPRPESVVRWGVRDPDFRAALDVAQARGDAVRRGLRFDWDGAEAVLARLRAGATLREVERDPGLPSRRTLRAWMAAQPGFQEEIERLRRGRLAARGERLGAARRGLAAWDERTADRVLFHVGQGVTLDGLRAADGALPSAWAVRRWARERPEFAHALKVNQKMGRLARGRARRRARIEGVCEAVAMGASLPEVMGRGGAPHRSTLYGWAARDKEIARALGQAADERTYFYADLMLDAAREVAPLDVKAARAEVKRIQARVGRLWQRPGSRWGLG